MEIKIKELGKIITGNTPSKTVAEFWNSEDICFVKPDIISEKGVNEILGSKEYISEKARKKARIVSENSIFITCIGSIGKIGIASEGEYAFNQQINAIVPNEKVNPRYLAYALFFNRPRLIDIANAPVVPIINKNQFGDFIINIDSDVNRQIEIAGVLDKLVNIIELREKELSVLDDLIKARFIELFNGKKYNYVKVSDVCDFITKGTTPKSDEIFEEYEAGRIPYLKVYNLSLTGDLFFDDAPQYINASTHEEKLARSKVYPNDVLMNIVGPPLGKFAFVTNEFNEWNINQAIAIFRAREKVIPRFLMAALMQPDVLQPFLQQAVGIRQLNLSLEQCRNLEIPLPPLELQQQFSVFVAEVDKSKVGKQRDSCVS